MAWFDEVKSRTVILRYVTTETFLMIWKVEKIQEWPYIVTNYTVFDDMKEEIKERFNVKGPIELVDVNNKIMTKPGQLVRRGVYTVVTTGP